MSGSGDASQAPSEQADSESPRSQAETTAADKPGGKPSGSQPAPVGAGKKRRGLGRELPVLIVIALVLAFLIKTFAVQAFYIPSGSMQNTLAIGDRILINKVVYHLRGIDRGDIVVFNGSGSWDASQPAPSRNIFNRAVDELESIVGLNQDPDIYVKRVIGLPGDHVSCCDAKGQVTVNGVGLDETSYLYPGNAPSIQHFNITVPKGRLWVMGDHRLVSYDSRGHMDDPGGGTIPEKDVLGRAFVVIWPPSQWGFLNIPATFEQPKLAAAAVAGGASLPLLSGFIGAVPLTLLQRKARRRLIARR